jgi:hypothetical protein
MDTQHFVNNSTLTEFQAKADKAEHTELGDCSYEVYFCIHHTQAKVAVGFSK